MEQPEGRSPARAVEELRGGLRAALVEEDVREVRRVREGRELGFSRGGNGWHLAS